MMKSVIAIFISIFCSLSLFADLQVDGEFNGWEGETVVKLSDGTFWIQSNYYYNYCYSYNPKVELYKQNGQVKMLISGCGTKAVDVRQLTDVIESRIDGEFEGFDDGVIFQLSNGSVWKQSRFKYWYHYAYNPECFIFNNNGWKLSVAGETIGVERISDNTNNITSNNSRTFIYIINNTNKTLYSCYTYYNTNGYWEINGWFKIEANSSKLIDIGIYSGDVYVYAEYNNGELYWGDKNSIYYFCVDKINAFKIQNPTTIDCNLTDFKKIQMSKLHVNYGYNTWTLTD